MARAEIIMRRGRRVNSKPSHYFPEWRDPLANALTFFLRKLTITGLSTFAAIFKTPSRNPASRSLPVDFLALFRSTETFFFRHGRTANRRPAARATATHRTA